MSELNALLAGEKIDSDYWNDSWSFILDAMLRLGIESGSFTNQVKATFDLFDSNTASGSTNMDYGAGSYTTQGSPSYPTAHTITSALTLDSDYTGSTATSAIARWIGSYSSDTTVTHHFSFDNGANWTSTNLGALGSISPSTGSILSRLTVTTSGSSFDTVTSMGMYYG